MTAPASAPPSSTRSSPGGYHGDLVVIHPRSAPSPACTAYPSFAEVPGPVDLVLVAVPPRQVTACVADAAHCRGPGRRRDHLGLRRDGPRGRRAPARAHPHGPRPQHPRGRPQLPGPARQPARRPAHRDLRRCADPPPGGSRSPRSPAASASWCSTWPVGLGLGVGRFVSLGNKADVSGNDLLAAWADDPDVTAARALPRVVRQPGEVRPGRPPLRRAQAAARRGRRSLRQRPAGGRLPHRGRGDPVGPGGRPLRPGRRDRLRRRRGPDRDRPAARRAATPGRRRDSRCSATPAAWACWRPTPRRATASRSRSSPRTCAPGSPRTCSARSAPATRSTRAPAPRRRPRPDRRAAARDSDEVDALLVVLAATGTLDAPADLAALERARSTRPGKPMVIVALGGLDAGRLERITSLPSVGSALRALAHATRYAAWRRTPRTPSPTTPGDRFAQVRSGSRHTSARRGPAGCRPTTSPPCSRRTTSTRPVWSSSGPPRPAAAAAQVGLPVAVKVADPTIVHKSERGLVRVRARHSRRRERRGRGVRRRDRRPPGAGARATDGRRRRGRSRAWCATRGSALW